jgi:hypothetical protein
MYRDFDATKKCRSIQIIDLSEYGETINKDLQHLLQFFFFSNDACADGLMLLRSAHQINSVGCVMRHNAVSTVYHDAI